MQKITPFLWFNDNAQEAVAFYCATFPNARVINSTPGPGGTVMSLTFELEGQPFMALNGGPHYKFNEAVSFFVSCKDQAEVDNYWNKILAAGGTEQQCGWIKDKFGLSWQIIPTALMECLGDPDRAASGRAMQAMLQMTKIDVAALQAARAG